MLRSSLDSKVVVTKNYVRVTGEKVLGLKGSIVQGGCLNRTSLSVLKIIAASLRH